MHSCFYLESEVGTKPRNDLLSWILPSVTGYIDSTANANPQSQWKRQAC